MIICLICKPLQEYNVNTLICWAEGHSSVHIQIHYKIVAVETRDVNKLVPKIYPNDLIKLADINYSLVTSLRITVSFYA